MKWVLKAQKDLGEKEEKFRPSWPTLFFLTLSLRVPCLLQSWNLRAWQGANIP